VTALGARPDDSFSFTDELIYSLSKHIEDDVTIGDIASLGFSRLVADSMSVTDSPVISPGKVASDGISATDSGSLRGQGYCDFTYFAEDYVGYSLTF
jgi:hypothetical protein